MAQPQQQRNGRQQTRTKPLKIKEGKKGRDPENYRLVKQMIKSGKLIKAIIKNRIGGVCINIEIEKN